MIFIDPSLGTTEHLSLWHCSWWWHFLFSANLVINNKKPRTTHSHINWQQKARAAKQEMMLCAVKKKCKKTSSRTVRRRIVTTCFFHNNRIDNHTYHKLLVFAFCDNGWWMCDEWHSIGNVADKQRIQRYVLCMLYVCAALYFYITPVYELHIHRCRRCDINNNKNRMNIFNSLAKFNVLKASNTNLLWASPSKNNTTFHEYICFNRPATITCYYYFQQTLGY